MQKKHLLHPTSVGKENEILLIGGMDNLPMWRPFGRAGVKTNRGRRKPCGRCEWRLRPKARSAPKRTISTAGFWGRYTWYQSQSPDRCVSEDAELSKGEWVLHPTSVGKGNELLLIGGMDNLPMWRPFGRAGVKTNRARRKL